MEQAFIYVFSIFGNFLNLIFNDFTFTAFNYTVSVGWLILGATLISMIIASILNIPQKLPNKAYMDETYKVPDPNTDEGKRYYARRSDEWVFSQKNKGK